MILPFQPKLTKEKIKFNEGFIIDVENTFVKNGLFKFTFGSNIIRPMNIDEEFDFKEGDKFYLEIYKNVRSKYVDSVGSEKWTFVGQDGYDRKDRFFRHDQTMFVYKAKIVKKEDLSPELSIDKILLFDKTQKLSDNVIIYGSDGVVMAGEVLLIGEKKKDDSEQIEGEYLALPTDLATSEGSYNIPAKSFKIPINYSVSSPTAKHIIYLDLTLNFNWVDIEPESNGSIRSLNEKSFEADEDGELNPISTPFDHTVDLPDMPTLRGVTIKSGKYNIQEFTADEDKAFLLTDFDNYLLGKEYCKFLLNTPADTKTITCKMAIALIYDDGRIKMLRTGGLYPPSFSPNFQTRGNAYNFDLLRYSRVVDYNQSFLN